jgi:pimeloyl-ACP methyl ester carboxylesterase
MTQQAGRIGKLERRIQDAERNLFAATGLDVEESFIELGQTGRRARVLTHGRGPKLVLLHGVSLSAAVWTPLFTELPEFQLIAVDLPGHGLSDPIVFRRGHVRERAGQLIDDILDGLDLDQAPVIGHSLGGMFALWHLAAGSRWISELIVIGQPAVALPGVRVRMPLSLMTVRGVGSGFLRTPSPRLLFRRLLAKGFGSDDAAAIPHWLMEALRLSARRPENARSVASLMDAIDRFRRPRPESVLTSADMAAIRTPTTFILGSDDPYLSIDAARPSVERIPGARLHEVRGGHAPWLADPARAAALATSRLRAPEWEATARGAP